MHLSRNRLVSFVVGQVWSPWCTVIISGSVLHYLMSCSFCNRHRMICVVVSCTLLSLILSNHESYVQSKLSRSDFAKKHLSLADVDSLWRSLLLWIDIIISKTLHIKAIVHSPLSRKCKFVQVVVWLCFCGCVGSINLTYFSNARPTCDVKALANRTSDNRLHRYHPCRVNQWKGGHQPGHRDTNNMWVNDDLKKR